MPGPLFTDYYELTMMAGYARAGMAEAPAVFDLFFRHPPGGVPLIVAGGLELALEYLETLLITPEHVAALRAATPLPDEFVGTLEGLRFTGDVWAMPEGVPVFYDEPVLRVEAPLAQAQLVETALLNTICYSSLVASNAAEVAAAARGRGLLEFGARRAHGPDGALSASRAAYLGGCDATSNVEAGVRFGIPVAGTQAHAWIMAFPSELEAFRSYAATFPDDCVLLVDTYDTLAVGVPNAITVAHELRARGGHLAGIRLDSGDLDALARAARAQLDAAGLGDVRIVASGDLDAERVRALVDAGAPVDSFGVGTALVTAKSDPTISGVYKLAEVGGAAVLKVSATAAKTTSPGRKQVWRRADGDVIGLADEDLQGEPLLAHVMSGGRRLHAPAPLTAHRARCAAAVAEVRPRVLAGTWTVTRSERLDALRAALVADLADGSRDSR